MRLTFADQPFADPGDDVPVDVMLAPMVLADRGKWLRFATIATAFSVLGGLGGYAIGWGMFEAIEPWLRESHYWDGYLLAREWFDNYGVWVVFVAGFSPIPYKVFTIAAGVAVLNLPAFFIGSLVGRAGRFFLVAGLVRLGGQRFEDSLRKHVERIGWGVVAITAIAIGYFMMRG